MAAFASEGCPLQSWINRFAFEGDDAEDAFVDAAERFAIDEASQRFKPEREFAERQ